MSFNNLLNERLIEDDFGLAHYRLCYKARTHSSIAALDAYGKSERVASGGYGVYRYEGALSRRYVLAENLSYDFLVSVYDSNSRGAVALRPFDYSKEVMDALVGGMASFRKPNFEARIIGMQSGQDTRCLSKLSDWLIDKKVAIVEVDLFGSETRHIALDLKTGGTYNVLGENRHYSPSELQTRITLAQFKEKLAQMQSAKKERGKGRVRR